MTEGAPVTSHIGARLQEAIDRWDGPPGGRGNKRQLSEELRRVGAPGHARQTIHSYLQPGGRAPSPAFLDAASKILGVRLPWLAYGDGAMTEALDVRLTDVDLVNRVAGDTGGDPALRHPALAALIAETVNRKKDIEAMVRRRTGQPDVTSAELVKWTTELVRFVEDPSVGLPWDLPSPWEMGHEAWLSAAIATIQGVRQRIVPTVPRAEAPR